MPGQAAAALEMDLEEQVARLRSLVQDCLAKHMHGSAVFYADKLVTLSGYAPGDVFLLAQVRLCVCSDRGGSGGACVRAGQRQTADAAAAPRRASADHAQHTRPTHTRFKN